VKNAARTQNPLSNQDESTQMLSGKMAKSATHRRTCVCLHRQWPITSVVFGSVTHINHLTTWYLLSVKTGSVETQELSGTRLSGQWSCILAIHPSYFYWRHT